MVSPVLDGRRNGGAGRPGLEGRGQDDGGAGRDVGGGADLLEELRALAELDRVTTEVLAAYEAFEFHNVYRALFNFSTVTLSARYFDIIKDRLYTFAPRNQARRSAQTALLRIGDALARLLAPILAFTADEIWEKLQGFAHFGFPESHSVSFAYIVYMSAWLKYHWPAETLAGLLNAQPMGFYSPNSLVQDARRHGVEVLEPREADRERLDDGRRRRGRLERHRPGPLGARPSLGPDRDSALDRRAGEQRAREIHEAAPRGCGESPQALPVRVAVGSLSMELRVQQGRGYVPAASAAFGSGSWRRPDTQRPGPVGSGCHRSAVGRSLQAGVDDALAAFEALRLRLPVTAQAVRQPVGLAVVERGHALVEFLFLGRNARDRIPVAPH